MVIQLGDILASGEIPVIKKGGTEASNDVPNNAEVDARVVNILEGNITLIKFDKDLLSNPGWEEATLFYDKVYKCLVLYNDQSTVAMQIGREFMARAMNDTGVDMQNGIPVIFAGVDVATKVAKIAPADASNISTARVVGVTTQIILDGEIGEVTGRGEVNGIDTTGLNTNGFVYLAEGGGFTMTAPHISCIIGAIIFEDNVDGIIHVDPENFITFPSTIGLLDGKAATMDLTTTYQDITNYTLGVSVISTVDAIAGTITPPANGWYRTTINTTMTIPTSSQTRSITLQVWDVTLGVQKALSTITIAKDGTAASRAFSKLLLEVAGNEYVLRIKASTAMNGVIFEDVSLDSVSVNIN